jgi:hypothetical protein
MRTSKTIAGLIGPTVVAVAVAVVLNFGSFPALAEQAAVAAEVGRSTGLIVASAIVLLVLGAILSFKDYSRD